MDFRARAALAFQAVKGSATVLLGMLAPDLLDEASAYVREASREDPANAIVWTVLVASHLFYKAEVGHNPKVKTLNDAFVYVSTNLSVGFCDIFATTERGKQIATLLMTFGPALAARALDETAAEKREAAAEQDKKHDDMLARLDRIATLLEGPATVRT